ncbi:unnamed protein product [Linum trigynum]|uniref:Integrase catalytic domain-containing protein n=1 Tax=Linum trigynum TaxID=586398 RepID=A0AAV2CR03_9ROSI
MDLGKMDSVSIKFDGKNFAIWEFHFRNFVAGQRLLSVLTGETKQPGDDAPMRDIEDWNAGNARLITWLLGSVDMPTGLSLRRFSAASDMWRHLCTTYAQNSASRQFELETAIARLAQGDRDIRGYYQASLHLWTEYDLLTASLVPVAASAAVVAERSRTRVLQFLAKLRSEFEPIRASLIHRNITQIDDVVAELMREETRLKSQAQIDNSGFESAFAVGRPPAASRPQFGSPATTEIICHFCREPGHIQIHCKKKNFCNYCKRSGHIVLECPTLSRRGKLRPASSTGSSSSARTAYPVTLGGGEGSSTAAGGSSGASLTPDQIRRLVQDALQEALSSAFATTVSQGKSSRWLLDSAAFNHMTRDRTIFAKLSPVDSMSLQVANGATIPVHGSGTVNTGSIALPNTLYVPQLRPNLVSVGQLTDDGCTVMFDSTGCVVQDRETGRVLGRGSKTGRAFVLDDYCGADGHGVYVDKAHAWEDSRGNMHGQSHQDTAGNGENCGLECSGSFCNKDDVVDLSAYSLDLSVGNSLWDLWHYRLGHPHSGRLKTMFRQNLLPDRVDLLQLGDISDCVNCIEAKTSQRSFQDSDSVYDEPFDLVHTDLWGPSPVTSRMGFRYFALFIDHKTRYTWVYFLKRKSELATVAKQFISMIRTQFGKTIKILRSDPGGEFVAHELLSFFQLEGILQQQSCPGVSQQNGVVERKHRHVLELTRAILFHSRVPVGFWVEAIHTIVYLINRQITPLLGQKSPFQALYSRLPDYSSLRVFGCTCFVMLPRQERHKLAPKVTRCVFVGYSEKHKGYLCYDPSDRRMRIAYHVKFLEKVMYYSTSHVDASSAESLEFLTTLPMFDETPSSPVPAAEPTSSSSSSESVEPSSPDNSSFSSSSSSSPSTGHGRSLDTSSSSSDSSTSHHEESQPPSPTQPLIPLRRSARANLGQPPPRMNDFVSYSVAPITIPTHYSQAARDPRWNAAMRVEMDALEENHTWDLVPREENMQVIGSRWVYNIKMHPDGAIERFKARVVAQGFKQEYGIDYEETFAPVVKMQTVRCVFAVAAMKGWSLIQLDVKNAFLHGNLKETIYMERPPGYEKGDSTMVCKLIRSLYGLKQAPRAWFEKFHGTILQAGFVQSQNDPSLFTRQTVEGIVILLIYVDDMIITGSDQDGIREVTEVLRNAFNLKEMGEVSYFLGLEIKRSANGLFVSQRKYILDLLESAQYTDCVPCSTPMEQNLKLSREEGDKLKDQSLYRSLVGSLIYLTHTRPDISYAVQVVSQFVGVATHLHLAAVQRLLRYLKQTQDVGLLFPATGDPTIEAFADADYAGCLDTRKSTSGWCVRVGQALVSWRCRKQDRVSKSSTEAEYRSMSEVSSELVWLHRLLKELGVDCRVPMRIYGDNTSAIQIAVNPVMHDRTKHIEVHVHYIRQLVAEGLIQVGYLSTEDQTADLLTKAVASSRHWYLSSKLMLRTAHQFEGGC